MVNSLTKNKNSLGIEYKKLGNQLKKINGGSRSGNVCKKEKFGTLIALTRWLTGSLGMRTLRVSGVSFSAPSPPFFKWFYCF